MHRSSKSGSTLEPNIYKQYFFDRVKAKVGEKKRQSFIAIHDPGSKMQQVPKLISSQDLHGCRDRGRYSELSNFGMVPCINGLDCKFPEQNRRAWSRREINSRTSPIRIQASS